MAKLILVRGWSGSGKTTKAKSLGCFHVEADMALMKDGEYIWTQERVIAAHRWCEGVVENAMRFRMDIAVSNMFVKPRDMKKYIALANEYNYEVIVIRCIGNFGNDHFVNDEHLADIKRRFVDYEGEVIYDPSH
jgi:predicted kinase